MNIEDKDLVSIQEARGKLKLAKEASTEMTKKNQEEIDTICKAIAKAAYDHREELARMAVEDTGFGNVEDKIIKNSFAARGVLNAMENMKTIGIINKDPENKVMEIAVPNGVIAGLIPSTNPTSTVIYKALIALKGGNTIVFSPHPAAKRSILRTVEVIKQKAIEAGMPEDAIQVMTTITKQATNELMTSDYTNKILATGGTAMVKAAYSSGTPAIGVGPGNGPSYIHNTANIPSAVRKIIDSKTFDNGIICSSEQSIIVEKKITEDVQTELKKSHAVFLDAEDSEILSNYVLRANGTMNPLIVGKTANDVAKLAGITIPENTSVIIVHEDEVGQGVPYSREKLAPILAYYEVDNEDEALSLVIEILNNEGAGHTMSLHAEDDNVVQKFAVNVPVYRLLVNTPATLGGIGATTNIFPAYTLGCGAVGGSSTSNNVGPFELIDIRRVAYGVSEMQDIR